jgi:hypothetical protein
MEKNGKLRFDIGACKAHIDKMLDDLYKQSFELELHHKAALEAMYGRLKDKLHLHGGGGGGGGGGSLTRTAYQWLGDGADFAAWVRGLAGLKPAQSQALHHLYECITAAADPPPLELCCDKTQPRLLIVKNGSVVATCHVSKSKIDVVFELSKEDLAQPLTLHPMFETLKNNEITITLPTSTLTSECYAVICRRLVGMSPYLIQQEEPRKKPAARKRKAVAAAAAAADGGGQSTLSAFFKPT